MDFKGLSDKLKNSLSLVVAELHRGQEQISGEFSAISEFIHRLNTDITLLSGKKEVLTFDVSTLEGKINEANKELDRLKKQGNEEIVRQKENLDRIIREESARLKIKNDEINRKENEAENILNNAKQAQAEAQVLLTSSEKEKADIKNESGRLDKLSAENSNLKESLDLFKMTLEAERQEIDKNALTAAENFAYASDKEKSALAIQEDNLNIKKINLDMIDNINQEREKLGRMKRNLDDREKSIQKKELEINNKQTDIDRQYKNLKDKEFNLTAIEKEMKKKK